MVATYFSRGRGRSLNAQAAEADGRMPLSRAKKVVAAQHGCTQTVAAAALELLHDGEWHHVGKYAAAVAYYDTEDSRLAGAVAHIRACGGAKKFVDRRLALRKARRSNPPAYRHYFGGPRILNIQAAHRAARALASEALGYECVASALASEALGYECVASARKTDRIAAPEGFREEQALWLALRGYDVAFIRKVIGS